jgi:hypothetical protein
MSRRDIVILAVLIVIALAVVFMTTYSTGPGPGI